jgi:hypothetical protein
VRLLKIADSIINIHAFSKPMSENPDVYSPHWGKIQWSSWIPLDAILPEYQLNITTQPGFYRIRSSQHPGLVYLGETGRDLRERVRSLMRGVYRSYRDPPWNDPHTAAPILWAFRHEDQLEYQVSASPLKVSKPQRQCHEDFLLHLHRVQLGYSTLANHGRLHPHWTRPRNRKNGIPAQRRQTPMQYPSLPSATGSQDYLGIQWLGLNWSPFQVLHDVNAPSCPGVYRIRKNSCLLYCGQSTNLQKRIHTHQKASRFRNSQISFHQMDNSQPHQLKERETDLIGAYFACEGEGPSYQYRPVS